MKKSISKVAASLATVTAFFGSCCALPLLLLSLGVGSAGFASVFAPFRAYLIGITLLLLGIAFYAVYGCRQTCEGEGSCETKDIRRTKILLWIATILAFLFLLGPTIIDCVF